MSKTGAGSFTFARGSACGRLASVSFACASIALAAAGCALDRSRDAPSSSVSAVTSVADAAAKASPNELPPTVVELIEVQAAPTIESIAVRNAFRDADAALSSCLDESGSTGVLSIRFWLEPEGAVGGIAETRETTLGNEEMRTCMERLINSLRFPPSGSGKPEITVKLEIRTRH